jgi:hypothetical protein
MRPGRTEVAGMLGRGRARALHQWIRVAALLGALAFSPRLFAERAADSLGT